MTRRKGQCHSKIFGTLFLQRRRRRATWGSSGFWSEDRKECVEANGLSFFEGSVGKAGEGCANSLGLFSLNNSSRLWDLGAVPGHQVPESGLILSRGNTGLVSERSSDFVMQALDCRER